MIYGVTGTGRMLLQAEIDYVQRITRRTVLRNRRNKLVSGMQHGVDTEAILAVWGLLPFENIICVIPGTAIHNYGLVDKCRKAGATVIKSPNGYTAGETYLQRDTEVVNQIQILLAFPIHPTFYRSGTWATINRAKKASKKVRMYPLAKVEDDR